MRQWTLNPGQDAACILVAWLHWQGGGFDRITLLMCAYLYAVWALCRILWGGGGLNEFIQFMNVLHELVGREPPSLKSDKFCHMVRKFDSRASNIIVIMYYLPCNQRIGSCIRNMRQVSSDGLTVRIPGEINDCKDSMGC